MDILILVFVSMLFSFVGVMVKLSSFAVSSYVITFCRFFFGIVFLAVILLVKDKKLKVSWKNKWIWYGAIAKSINYYFENIAISMGYAYMGVIVMPLQVICLMFASVLLFKEKINAKTWISAVLCIAGVFLVSWNGLPIAKFINTNGIIVLLFIFAALGASVHQLSQKILIDKMTSRDMNYSVFFWCSLMTVIPLPFMDNPIKEISLLPVAALVILGFITGVSFLLYAGALKRVQLVVAILIINSSVLFSILWSWLFFNEPVTTYVIIGALLFLAGLVILNSPNKQQAAATSGEELNENANT